jgi:hypothetical protein
MDEIDHMKNFIIWMKSILYIFRHIDTLTFMDELWPHMDEITYWFKHIFVIEGSFIWNRQHD